MLSKVFHLVKGIGILSRRAEQRDQADHRTREKDLAKNAEHLHLFQPTVTSFQHFFLAQSNCSSRSAKNKRSIALNHCRLQTMFFQKLKVDRHPQKFQMIISGVEVYDYFKVTTRSGNSYKSPCFGLFSALNSISSNFSLRSLVSHRNGTHRRRLLIVENRPVVEFAAEEDEEHRQTENLKRRNPGRTMRARGYFKRLSEKDRREETNDQRCKPLTNLSIS